MTSVGTRIGSGLLLTVLAFCQGSADATTIWTGPNVTFTKLDFADFNDPANQDRMTDNVWITRQNLMGIYNIRTETSYVNFVSPADTEWAFGTTADIGSLTFQEWRTWHGMDPPATVGQDAVLHLISDDIFIDIKVLSWTPGPLGGGSGGGFSYQRTTPAPELAGDTNGDFMVNIIDLNNVRNNFGAMGSDDGTLAGDAVPFDGMVNLIDLNAVRNNFGAGAAVPEPGTWLLTVLGCACVVFAGRWRSQPRNRVRK